MVRTAFGLGGAISRIGRAGFLAVAVIVIAGCGTKTGSAAAPKVAFDGDRAYALLKKQCSFGPRYTGTPGQTAMVDWMKSELKPFADEVTTSRFRFQTTDGMHTFENVYAVFNPSARRFVFLCAHWDTRPMADEEVNEVKRKQPILGANDGASGVAVLMELGRMFKAEKPEVGVVMAFFDGEDYGASSKDMFIGARWFASNWKKAVRPGGKEISYDYGILLDMIGDKDLSIPKEVFSASAAPDVCAKVWGAAKSLGYGETFPDTIKYAVDDDHRPLTRAGIKTIDLIDFDYAPWHTLDDTPDKCSARSLKAVGDVVAKVIYDEGRRQR